MSSGVEVNQEQQFMVDTKGAGGQGRLEVAVVSVNECCIYFLSLYFDFYRLVRRISSFLTLLDFVRVSSELRSTCVLVYL